MATLDQDQRIFEMALVGYEAERAKINAAIVAIRAQLGHRGPGRPRAAVEDAATEPRKRTMSAAARKRIAAAQRKRWAAFKKEKAKTAKAEAPTK